MAAGMSIYSMAAIDEGPQEHHGLGEKTPDLTDSEELDAETEDDDDAVQARMWEEYLELLEAAKTTLPVPFREDGPPLGCEFDDVPSSDEGPGRKEKKSGGGKSGQSKMMVIDDYEAEAGADGKIQGIRKRKTGGGSSGRRKVINAATFEEKLQQKRQQELARAEKKRLEEEKKAKREADKAAQKQRKMEQTMKKEQERLERERKKALERAEREREKEERRKAREEEKLRAQQLRELKKVELQKEKERKQLERKQQQEKIRRKKELQKALVKAATKALQKQMDAGPPDDEDLEWEKLVESQRAIGYGSDTGGSAMEQALLQRPEFPPPTLGLKSAFPHFGDKVGGDILMVWSFVHSFREVFGLRPFTVDDLVDALFDGQSSKLLSTIHIGLIQILQADMEESHNLVVVQGGGGTANFMDRAVVATASILDEAWAWGFDVDVWRAHLNELTWPEIFRQLAIAAGHGPRRPKAGKDPKPKLGTEGEDVVVDESGGLRLKMPSRFAPGTVKAAAWQVLAEAGPEGLSIAEIAKRIQKQGLRDLRTSKTPEASVAGGLSRDVVFTRVAPATYALQAVVAYHRRLLQNAAIGDGDAQQKELAKKMDDVEVTKQSPEHLKNETDEGNCTPVHVDDLDVTDDEELVDEDEAPGEPWVCALMASDYDGLSFEDKLAGLVTLTNMGLDGPTIRSYLDTRLDSQFQARKRQAEEAKAEKRRKQAEAATRAEQAAEEAQRRLLQLQSPSGGLLAPEQAGADARMPDTLTAGDQMTPNIAIDSAIQDAILDQANTTPPHTSGALACSTAVPLIAGKPPDGGSEAKKAESLHDGQAIRYESLGMDRRFNRYWKFASTSEDGLSREEDPCSRCVFVESVADGSFRLLERPEQLQELKAVLDTRGAREGPMFNALAEQEHSLSNSEPGWRERPVVDPEFQQAVKRRRHTSDWYSSISVVAQRWIVDDEYVSEIDVPAADPVLRKLKQELLRMEAVLSQDCFEDWDRYQWIEAVRQVPNVEELRDCLGRLEAALVRMRVSPGFNRNPLLVQGAWVRVGSEVASAVLGKKGEVQQLPEATICPEDMHGTYDPLAWLPATYSSIALRLLALDSAIMYRSNVPPARETLHVYKYIQRPAAPEYQQGTPVSTPSVTPDCKRKGKTTVFSGDPIGLGGQVIASVLPAFPQTLTANEERQEFSIKIDELLEEVAQAETDGTMHEPMPLVSTSGRGRGRRGGGRGRGRGSGGRKGRKRTALALELDKISDDDDVTEDNGLSEMEPSSYEYKSGSAYNPVSSHAGSGAQTVNYYEDEAFLDALEGLEDGGERVLDDDDDEDFQL